LSFPQIAEIAKLKSSHDFHTSKKWQQESWLSDTELASLSWRITTAFFKGNLHEGQVSHVSSPTFKTQITESDAAMDSLK
jgi:hypothetical protein